MQHKYLQENRPITFFLKWMHYTSVNPDKQTEYLHGGSNVNYV